MSDQFAHGTRARGESHGHSKLTVAQVKEIRTIYKGRGKGPSQRALAEFYGVSQVAISQVITGKTWGA